MTTLHWTLLPHALSASNLPLLFSPVFLPMSSIVGQSADVNSGRLIPTLYKYMKKNKFNVLIKFIFFFSKINNLIESYSIPTVSNNTKQNLKTGFDISINLSIEIIFYFD